MIEKDSVGARIARYRKLRGLSQHQLAVAAGVSYSMISKVESGHASASASMIGMIAQGLRLDAGKLNADGDDEEQSLDIAPIIRRTLAAVDLAPDDLEPESLNVLRPLVAQVGNWRRGAQYRKIAEVLPDLVDRLLISGQEEGEPAYSLLTDAYRAANTLAHKLGYTDMNLTATERMVWAATQSGDPLLLANTHYVKAATLARVGAAKAAMKLLTRSMADIEPLVDEDATAAAVYSTLHMRAGMIASSMADSDSSRAHLAEAAMLAPQFGDRVIYETVVGPTNVRLYQMAAEVDLGNPGRAVEIAQGTRLPVDMANERKTYFWLDSARAHLLNGDPDAAIEALCESRLVSPEHFRVSPTVKATVRAAAAQQRRASDSLRSLANSAGVAD